MENESLSLSFGESIKNNVLDPAVDTAEIVSDSVLEDGILKEVPLVKYAVSAYKILDDIKGRFYLRKIERFINSFNAGIASDEEVEKYRAKFSGKKRDSELSYIMVVLDKYIDMGKPEILAKLFLTYLDQVISWSEFCAYAEVLDKILITDLSYLRKSDSYTIHNNMFPSELLRLTGVGLMYGYQNDSAFESDGHGGMMLFSGSFSRLENKERVFYLTEFGRKLKNIITEEKGQSRE